MFGGLSSIDLGRTHVPAVWLLVVCVLSSFGIGVLIFVVVVGVVVVGCLFVELI